MIYQSNYTSEGAAQPDVPVIPPNPEKVTEIYLNADKVTRESGAIGMMSYFLAYLGDPFACMASFESIDELGASEDGKKYYKESFAGALNDAGLEVEWESEYHLKSESDNGVDYIYATYNGGAIFELWRSGITLSIERGFVERALKEQEFDMNDSQKETLMAVREGIKRVIEEENLCG